MERIEPIRFGQGNLPVPKLSSYLLPNIICQPPATTSTWFLFRHRINFRALGHLWKFGICQGHSDVREIELIPPPASEM